MFLKAKYDLEEAKKQEIERKAKVKYEVCSYSQFHSLLHFVLQVCITSFVPNTHCLRWSHAAALQEWLAAKKQADRANREKEKATLRAQAAEKEEQRRRSEDAFNQWKNKAENRPPPARNSFGYSGGKLTG